MQVTRGFFNSSRARCCKVHNQVISLKRTRATSSINGSLGGSLRDCPSQLFCKNQLLLKGTF